jgi:thioredoxin-like negative regulator of GroEL
MQLFGLRSLTSLLLFALAGIACAEYKWSTNYASAAKSASSSGKPIFIVFHAEWCGPCKMLEQNVFPTPKVQALLSRVVGVRLDVDQNPPQAKAYGVSSIPRMILLSSDGKRVLWDAMGYRDADMFLEEFSAALGVKAPLAASASAPAPLVKVQSALSAGSWAQLKATDPAGAAKGLALLVEQLGVFQEAQFKELAALVQKAGRDALPALVVGLGHKHLAVRAGAYRAVQGIAKSHPAFDPWAPASVRKAQLAGWRKWLSAN